MGLVFGIHFEVLRPVGTKFLIDFRLYGFCRFEVSRTCYNPRGRSFVVFMIWVYWFGFCVLLNRGV